MEHRRPILAIRWIVHRAVVVTVGLVATVALFLLLPLLESITKTPPADTMVRTVDTGKLPEPPPPMEEEKPKEEPPPADEEPPALAEDAPPLDLATMELALNIGTGGFGADFAVNLPVAGGGAAARESEVEELFSLSDLDTKPRAIYQPSPALSAALRKKAPGLVHVIFVVDERGKVIEPTVQSSTDAVFNSAALAAVKQWKFEPGKRSGQPVRTRMRVPITFPKGQSS